MNVKGSCTQSLVDKFIPPYVHMPWWRVTVMLGVFRYLLSLLHSDCGQHSNLSALRPLRPQSVRGSTVPVTTPISCDFSADESNPSLARVLFNSAVGVYCYLIQYNQRPKVAQAYRFEHLRIVGRLQLLS
ncbi:hypothetical protein E2C01_038963 [Portunus trituberculatus]|uniref:Uncharacterized protein n=1 Tax=Portunus trituberculatus TaxID=210409 RepID=A0A5B7FJX4_PORTR|nr:hypothetical protein [Portunus trituberculatus]